MGPGCASDIQVVGEGSAVCGWAWEGVLLTGLLCKITIKFIADIYLYVYLSLKR